MFRILLALFTLFLLYSSVAWAAQYRVEVRQVRADKDPYTYSVICDDTKISCHVFMGISPQNNTSQAEDLELDIGMVFANKNIYFQFKSGWNYFFLSDGGQLDYLPIKGGIQNRRVKLYMRSAAENNDPVSPLYRYPVVRPPARLVAELEMSIKPAQE